MLCRPASAPTTDFAEFFWGVTGDSSAPGWRVLGTGKAIRSNEFLAEAGRPLRLEEVSIAFDRARWPSPS